MTERRTISLDHHIGQFAGWSVKHRINSALPGYLMIAATEATSDLSELPAESLSSFGTVLARVQHALTGLGAKNVYIGRFGHSPGYPIHFHAIPIYQWVEDLFWKDDRYRLPERFAHGPGQTPNDGAELTLFIWREFCERPDSPTVVGCSVPETISILRQAILL